MNEKYNNRMRQEMQLCISRIYQLTDFVVTDSFSGVGGGGVGVGVVAVFLAFWSRTHWRHCWQKRRGVAQ